MTKSSARIRKDKSPACPLCNKPVIAMARNTEIKVVIYIHAYDKANMAMDGCRIPFEWQGLDLKADMARAVRLTNQRVHGVKSA